jgi:putative nucleotidyltransferase with HDIG domain
LVLDELINYIENVSLRKKVRSILKHEETSIEIEYKALDLEKAPASVRRHHSYRGGLLDHIKSTMKIALVLCETIESVYHGKINRDYVIAGVLLHDFFKTVTYQKNEDNSYSLTTLGQKLDHLSLILAEAYRMKLPVEVLHILAAHHGEASPIRPHSIEALVVHIADSADAKLINDVFNAARWAMRDCIGKEVRQLSADEAFRLVYARQSEGCEGVKKIRE